MKKKLLVAFIILLCGLILVACGNYNTTSTKNSNTNPTTTDKKEDSIRTTITEDEWNKTLQMNNYTITFEMPGVTKNSMVTEKVIKEEYPTIETWYYVYENSCFYGVHKVSDMWCKYTNPIEDPEYSLLSHFMNINLSFSDLTYNEESKSYSAHRINGTEEFESEFVFLNGVLTQIKDSSPEWDFVPSYTFTNIGVTVVEVPEYITLSFYHALQVMPNGGGFEEVDISSYSLPSTIKEAHKAVNGGYVFMVEFSGYYSGNIAAIGVDANGNVTGTLCFDNREAMGRSYIENFDENGYYVGQNLGTIDGVDLIATCTVTTKAYRNAVKDCLEAAKILNALK